MFGYIIANPELLSDEQRQRYRECYCGLCRAIGEECSSLSRLSLNYDMTFLVLLLSSLYEPEETHGKKRCPVHPAKAQSYWYTDASRYCAAMNAALAAYNCLDDWHDDRNLLKLLEAQLFRGPAAAARRRYPRQIEAITTCLAELTALEKRGVPDPDGAANCFGRLMGELFVWKEHDHWAPTLRAVGEGLGRYLYILDAAVDLPEDLRRNRYNPLSGLAEEGRTLKAFREELSLLMGECTEAFERLPLVQDVELLRNILYSGVWIRYAQALEKQQTKEEKGGPHGSRSL